MSNTNPTFYSSICGKCLHTKESHTAYNGNGKLMYCASCDRLCDVEEYIIIHHASTMIELAKIPSSGK